MDQVLHDQFMTKKARIQDAVGAVRNGMHPAQAAIHFKVRYQSLTNAMVNAGVRSRKMARLSHYSDGQLLAVSDLVLQSKLDNDEIAWATGVGYSTVRTMRRRLSAQPNT